MGSSVAYVGKLRELVEAEDKVRLDRVEKFLSPEFKRGEYDALFPPTWATVNIVDAGVKVELHEREDYLAEAAELDSIVGSVSASFEKSTEDGSIFRIYEKGALEVRTVQEFEGEEVVGVVYSKRAQIQARRGGWLQRLQPRCLCAAAESGVRLKERPCEECGTLWCATCSSRLFQFFQRGELITMLNMLKC